MRRFVSILPAVFCLLLAAPATAFAAEPGVTIVYASGLADIRHRDAKGGLPELSSLVRALRAGQPNVIFFFGGNALGPSPLSSFDKGAHMVGLLNLLEPALMAVGRRDFMHGEDELALRGREAVFPLICSNIADPATGETPTGMVRDLTLDEGDHTIGFAALVSPGIRTAYTQERVTVRGGYELLPAIGADLRREGADFTIVAADFDPVTPEAYLASRDVDVLIYSAGKGESAFTRYGETLFVVQGGEDEVVVLDLAPGAGDSARLEVVGMRALRLGDFAPDPEITAPLAEYAGSLEALLRIPVGVVTTPVDTSRTPLRTGENAFGNLVADAMREYYGSDAAFINSGGLRGNRRYPAGLTWTREDLQTEMPLHDMSCLLDVRGAALLAALEFSVDSVETAHGKFLQTSGLRYSFDPSASPGARIRSVNVGGKALDPAATYTVSLPIYLADGGDGFTMFGGACRVDAPRPPQELVELVRVYINSHGEVSPQVEERITIVGQ
jgi:2',3'-cyclic-nucleotide 2'-phosphodiesterase (5'-nucleotidase family)